MFIYSQTMQFYTHPVALPLPLICKQRILFCSYWMVGTCAKKETITVRGGLPLTEHSHLRVASMLDREFAWHLLLEWSSRRQPIAVSCSGHTAFMLTDNASINTDLSVPLLQDHFDNWWWWLFFTKVDSDSVVDPGLKSCGLLCCLCCTLCCSFNFRWQINPMCRDNAVFLKTHTEAALRPAVLHMNPFIILRWAHSH